MTIRLYWNDAYLKEFDSKVEKIEDNKVILHETIFYPTSGGVLNDTGFLVINRVDHKVIDVRKNGDEILHQIEGAITAKPDDSVHGVLDWDRRYSLMRYHTAVHLLDGVFEKNYKNGRITGGTVFPDRARLDFEMDELNKELAQKIIDQTNAIAQEGHNVMAKQLTKEEALAIPNLARTEPGREMIKNMESVRVVEIEGVDMQMDGGLHVANTKEIGKIVLSKYENKGKHSKRVEITLTQEGSQ